MASDSTPSGPFSSRQAVVFALAGTVALPSPRPATGQVFLGVTSKHNGNPLLPTAFPKYYVKSIETVNDSLRITRIINLDDLKAIGFITRATLSHPETFETKTVDHKDIVKSLEAGIKGLVDGNGGEEVLLFEAVVLYVPEGAPVFVRIVREFGVTAAMAAENVESCVLTVCCYD